MQTTSMKSAVKLILAIGLGVAAVEGCGSSSSSSTDPVALCTQSCVKVEMCLADASASSATPTCMANCMQSAAGGASGQGTTCTNEAAIESAYNACLKMDCSQLLSCIAAVPACQSSGTGSGGATGKGGTTGGAGASGTGGATGTGGAGGAGAGATCASCDKAVSCCTTLGGGATCSQVPSTSACNAATGSTQSSDITTCASILSSAGSLCP